jgi:hypothetical protein
MTTVSADIASDIERRRDRASFLKMKIVQAVDIETGYNIMLTIEVLFSCLLLEQE